MYIYITCNPDLKSAVELGKSRRFCPSKVFAPQAPFACCSLACRHEDLGASLPTNRVPLMGYYKAYCKDLV